MKTKKNKKTAEAESVPVKPRNEWVHCKKCGAALKADKDKNAYICPVCGSLFRLRVVTRPTEQEPEEKAVRFTLSLALITKLNSRKKKKAKKATPRAQKKAERKLKRAVKTLFKYYVDLKQYREDEFYEVDLQEKNLVVTKKQDEKE